MTCRGQVIAEGVVHQVALAKARRMQGAGQAPVVRGGACRFIKRAGGGEQVAQVGEGLRAEAAERAGGGLALLQLRLAGQRQAGEVFEGVDWSFRPVGIGRGIGAGGGDMIAQGGEHLGIALPRRTSLKFVVVVVHWLCGCKRVGLRVKQIFCPTWITSRPLPSGRINPPFGERTGFCVCAALAQNDNTKCVASGKRPGFEYASSKPLTKHRFPTV